MKSTQVVATGASLGMLLLAATAYATAFAYHPRALIVGSWIGSFAFMLLLCWSLSSASWALRFAGCAVGGLVLTVVILVFGSHGAEPLLSRLMNMSEIEIRILAGVFLALLVPMIIGSWLIGHSRNRDRPPTRASCEPESVS